MKQILIILAIAMLVGCGNGDNPTIPDNHYPVVDVNADPTTMDCGVQSFVSCEAVDPDGDMLSYNWSSTGGEIAVTKDGHVVIFTAFQDGKYVVTCEACDPFGACDADSVKIEVKWSRACD